jgi:DEAD/DEAH box helicase domain-containing protein
MVATVAVDVTEFLVSVVEKDRSGATINQWNGNAGMPTHPLPTVGTMILLRPPLWNSVVSELGPQAAKSALQSCERLLWSLFPTISGPCDKQDFSSASEILPDGQAAIYLYDMVYDGVDLTTTAFDRVCELVQKADERLRLCECDTDEGCFRCIANPHYPDPASKTATATLLAEIKHVVCETSPEITRKQDDETALEEASETNCSACGERLRFGDRFCRNCGHKQEA